MKAHQPTDETIAQVKALAACGTKRDLIADYLGINKDTFLKYYGVIFQRSKIEKNARVASKLYDIALAGNVTAMIFWLKTQGQWKEEILIDESDLNVPSLNINFAVKDAKGDVTITTGEFREK